MDIPKKNLIFRCILIGLVMFFYGIGIFLFNSTDPKDLNVWKQIGMVNGTLMILFAVHVLLYGFNRKSER